MYNGRWVYQKHGADRYLEYGNKYWLGNTGVGKVSGHLHHQGGSVCPEDIAAGGWSISFKTPTQSWEWREDPQLKVVCVETKDHEVPQHIKKFPTQSGHGPKALPIRQPNIKGNNQSWEAVVQVCL